MLKNKKRITDISLLLIVCLFFTSFVSSQSNDFPYNRLDFGNTVVDGLNYSINVNTSENWITSEGILDNVADIWHSWLDKLLWSESGHTIDTDLDINGNNINMGGGNITEIDWLAFNITGCPDEIDTTKEGYMCWDADKHVLNMVTGLGNIVQLSQEMFKTVKNVAGKTIYAGQVVASNSSSGEMVEVVLANANVSNPQIHNLAVVTVPSCNDNADCIVTTLGEVHDVPTGSFAEGERIFLTCDGSGNLTNVRQPLLQCYHKYLGKVLRSHQETGIIDFMPELELENGVTVNSLGVINNLTVGGNITTNCITLEDGFQYCTLSTIYYNATSFSAVTGTSSGTINLTQHPNGDYDDITLNFTEQVSAPALDVRINFTDGIESFTQGIMRYYTSNLAGDSPTIYLWDYEDSEWESYGTLLETSVFETISQPVFDTTNHVQNGTVQMRLYKAGTGNINNEYYIDWFAIAKGFGVPAGAEVDPLSYHKGENINAIGYNITADYFFGNGSQLNDAGLWQTNGTITSLKNSQPIYTNDKVIFTQTDGNEFIDSLDDGYMDYYATKTHRFNGDMGVSGIIGATEGTFPMLYTNEIYSTSGGINIYNELNTYGDLYVEGEATIVGNISAENFNGNWNGSYWNRTNTTIYPKTESDILNMTSGLQEYIASNITGSVSITPSYGSGPFEAYGISYEFLVYGYKTIDGTNIFSPNYISNSFTDDGSTNQFSIEVNWTDNSANFDGYRIVLYDDWNGYYYDATVDSVTNILDYTSADSFSVVVTPNSISSYASEYPIVSNGADIKNINSTNINSESITTTDGIINDDLTVSGDTMLGGNFDLSRTYTLAGNTANDITGFIDAYATSDSDTLSRYPSGVIGQLYLRGTKNFKGQAMGLRGQVPMEANVAYDVVQGLFGRVVVRAGTSAVIGSVVGQEGAILFQSPYFNTITEAVGIRGTISGATGGHTITNAVLIDGSTTGFSGTGVANMYGIRLPAITQGGTSNWAIYTQGGNVGVIADNSEIIVGAGQDSSIKYDGTNMVFNTSKVGSGLAYFSNNVSATGFVTRTYTTDITDEEAYNLYIYAEENFYKDGVKNYSAWGECYSPFNVTDYSRQETREVCKVEPVEIDFENRIFENQRICYNEIIYPYQKLEEGINIDCKQVITEKAMKYLTQEFDGNVAYFNEIYTKSKVPEVDINYCQMIANADIYNKSNHYAYVEKNGKLVLDAEYRWVVLEGCEKQKLAEMCVLDKRYSWCEK